MSAIFGLVYFDGRPVRPESLEAMQGAMSHWGPDGCHTWRQDQAGLGQARLSVTLASQFEVMPLHDGESRQVLVAAARLDNREDLGTVFGIPPAERSTTPDGRLLRLAHQRWGEDSPGKLYGDWSFAVWDYRRQRLFLARDQLGNTGLYYYHRPPLFAFASSLKALLALPEVPRRLHEWQVACYLTKFSKGYGAGTFWQGIQRLRPGTAAVINGRGCQVKTYWRLEDARPVRLESEGEYLEGFLDRYRRAVHCRLEATGPVGATLSSGLDSGSVTALAAAALRPQGRRLTAFTSLPFYPVDSLAGATTGLVDEWPLAHATAEFAGNVDHIPVTAASQSPVAALARSQEIHQEPAVAPENAFWLLGILEAARQHGVRVLLTGQLGNGGISWYGGKDHIYYQFRRGHWLAGCRGLAGRKNLHGMSWPGAVKYYLLRPWLGPWRRQCRRLSRPAPAPWKTYAAIRTDFAHRLRLEEAMAQQDFDPSLLTPQAPEAERRGVLWHMACDAGPWAHASTAAWGGEVRDPTADVRLVEFCLGVPEQFNTNHGHTRLLLRRSLAGLMPPEVLNNTRFGYQGADLVPRLLAQAGEVQAALQRLSSAAAAQEMLDLDFLQETWGAVRQQKDPAAAYHLATLLMRGLAAGMFVATMAC